MKEKVIIFIEKELMKSIDQKEATTSYDETQLKDTISHWFPSKVFDVDVIEYPYNNHFRNINEIWSEVRTPILIGFGKGATYLERIKNYKRKYLFYPLYNEQMHLFNGRNDIDEYDTENTQCFFGSSPKEKESAMAFRQYYPQTTFEEDDEERSLIDNIELVGVYELFFHKGERDNQLSQQ